MLIIIGKGIFAGLVLAMTIGPVFFALIRTSIDKGFKSGAFLAIGIAASDAFAAGVVYSGISHFIENPSFKMGMSLIGGCLMLMFGITPFVKPPANQAYIPPKNGLHGGYLRFVGQGMLLNLLNPFVYLFWITIVASVLPATLGANFSNQDAFLFLSGIILTVFVTDLSKAYIANNITNFLTAHLITRIDQVAGVCLMAFGFYLFYFAAYGGQPIH